MSNSTKQVITLDLECTGVVNKGRAPQLPTPETYFDTLWLGLEEWYNFLSWKAASKGWGEPETYLSDINVSAMYAGQTQRFLIPFINGKGNHSLLISIYKRDEGKRVYEITAYIS